METDIGLEKWAVGDSSLSELINRNWKMFPPWQEDKYRPRRRSGS